ncbi:Rho termination factor, N-terminal [Dillenia turbinata]|uniref:Rho termination factor, N-terminal n=1 Tax=Dillenia turbinata TaxID=194707 RepID=A0AAN8UYF7_9MAGN
MNLIVPRREVLVHPRICLQLKNYWRFFANRQGGKGGFQVGTATSNFVRKSPIPLPSLHRATDAELNNEGSSVSVSVLVSETETPQIETMKLPELRAPAKSRALEGYSKLKKRELVELPKGNQNLPN